MKKLFILLLSFFLLIQTFAGNNTSGWSASDISPNRFIENKSQFDGKDKLADSKILFGIDQNGTQIYFSKQGLTYRFDKKEKQYKEDENENELEREKNKMTAQQWAENEKKEREILVATDLIHMTWENSNPDVELVAEEKTFDYFSYVVKGENINYVKGYKKLIYKNLYPNIDVEYVYHPNEGIKYSLIIHPGADASQVKMKYSNSNKISADTKGNLHIKTLFGDIIDHAPVTFYQLESHAVAITSGMIPASIKSCYVKTENIISFSLGNYDKTKTVIIDPWTQTPTLPNSNGVWECERDATGNVYIIGGCMPKRVGRQNSAL